MNILSVTNNLQEKKLTKRIFFLQIDFVTEITPKELKDWMKREKITQIKLAKMLETSQGTVNRWLKSVHAIKGPEQKLLAYLIRGELPFPIQNLDRGWNLDFSAEEFALIQVLARREGFASAEDWVVAKIHAYLSMTGAVGGAESIAAETPTAYTYQKRSSI